MTIKFRHYPLSSKLTNKNIALIFVNMVFAFAISIGAAFVIDSVSNWDSGKQGAIAIVLWMVVVLVGNAIINKHTDKEYEKVVEEYRIKCSKLIDQDPEQVMDKQLIVPAQIRLKRVKASEYRWIKIKYIVNGIEYALKNGEEINFSTTQALNSLEVKSKTNPTTYYFTVSDNDKLLIEVFPIFIHNIERN